MNFEEVTDRKFDLVNTFKLSKFKILKMIQTFDNI